MSDVCNFREGGNYVAAKTRQDRFKIFQEAKILPHMFPTQIVISLLASGPSVKPEVRSGCGKRAMKRLDCLCSFCPGKQTDRWVDGQMDQRTDPLIGMHS